MKKAHPALEKTREDATGEWFLLLELDDDPHAVERTTEEIGGDEALQLLIRVGVSAQTADEIITAARKAFVNRA